MTGFANFDIILASASPRRKELLEGTDIPFRVAPKFGCEESWPESLEAAKVSEYLSRLKSEAYPEPLAKNQVLITADTTVIVGGAILGKPRTREEAIAMIASLSGRHHQVVSGVTVRTRDCVRSFSESTVVGFREIPLDAVEYYVDRYRPFDKAGAYGIQEWIGYTHMDYLNGSFYNVMGLPVERLYAVLEEMLSL